MKLYRLCAALATTMFFGALIHGTHPALAQSILSRPEDLGIVMSAKEAHAKALAGELLLLDIRTPGEWRETGLPASAKALTMHQRGADFLAKLDELTGNDKSKPVALICAVGSRTTYLQAILRKLGYSHIINVAEGMIGGRFGPGWIKSGLPVRAYVPK